MPDAAADSAKPTAKIPSLEEALMSLGSHVVPGAAGDGYAAFISWYQSKMPKAAPPAEAVATGGAPTPPVPPKPAA